MSAPGAASRAIDRHRARWGEPEVVARAPGRVNLIGEHTDYNDGFALPMALPFDTVVAVGRGDTDAVEVDAAGFGTITIDPSAPADRTPRWAHHLVGVISVGAAHGLATRGWRATIDTDVPVGASLSSSAALEVAAFTAAAAIAGVELAPIEIARLGQRVEHDVVGVPSGVMDQLISAAAVDGHASLLDCRSLVLDPVPLPSDVTVMVLDSGTRRTLAGGAYAERRASCERAAAEIGLVALRDATLDDLEAVTDPIDRRRARHVVSENARTLAAADALRRGDAEKVGELMRSSHASLRDDYEVSGPALDAVVTVAESAPGCLGVRMTGGGFAGCAVALVDEPATDAFARSVVDRYDFDGHTATVWRCRPGAGASLVEPGRVEFSGRGGRPSRGSRRRRGGSRR